VRLESVTLSNFRCFGPVAVTVPLSDDITAVVGPNAAGKTALLQALAKLFGVSRAQRTVQRSDFHLAAGENPEERKPKALTIDVLIAFPELVAGTATPETVAPSFRHMQIERAGQAPVCRLRLEAQWQDDGTLEGEVAQQLFWVDTLDPTPSEKDCHFVVPADRGLIQLYYTPASRDAAAQIRASTGALGARLLRAIEWSTGTQSAVEKATADLATAFDAEAAIKAISAALKTRWTDLHDEVVATEPRLSLVSRRFEEVVNKVAVIFEQGPDGRERGLDALSDGQQSLFYFALAAAVFDLERQVVSKAVEGFKDDQLRIPALTILAIEEPENHLSPFFLARIVRQVRTLTKAGGAQAIVTSHSPAVLSRVDPREVRYCRCDPTTRVTSVKAVQMPPGAGEEAKFVRGAVLAYPELYFARFVVLVEGDSERIVLPKLAEALELLIDPAFVAIVPLGGRHVVHFWRLLNGLGIPYATLLDLDLGRDGGGWGRIKTAMEQLIAFDAPKSEVLATDTGMLSDDQFAKMHGWPYSDDLKTLTGWLLKLRNFGVYFSAPLDLDLAMLKCFPAAYEAIIPTGGGPKMAADKAAEVVLGTTGPGIGVYTGPLTGVPPLMPAYRYHFLTRSKPATHLAALTHIERDALRDKMPATFKALLTHVEKTLRRD
jgi:putative ATP-dependent endonuclease of the OLD family